MPSQLVLYKQDAYQIYHKWCRLAYENNFYSPGVRMRYLNGIPCSTKGFTGTNHNFYIGNKSMQILYADSNNTIFHLKVDGLVKRLSRLPNHNAVSKINDHFKIVLNCLLNRRMILNPETHTCFTAKLRVSFSRMLQALNIFSSLLSIAFVQPPFLSKAFIPKTNVTLKCTHLCARPNSTCL